MKQKGSSTRWFSYYKRIVMTGKLLLPVLFLLVASVAGSQSVGIGTSSPNGSALLDLNSSNKGLLIPRLTTAQRDAIAPAANGLTIYNITTKQFNYYDGGKWQALAVLPKGAMVLSLTYDDPELKNQGFSYAGYLVSDLTSESLGDSTIAANTWYKGNTYYNDNAGAPGCSESYSGIFIDSLLYCFTYDTIFIYSRATDKWRSLLMNPAFHDAGNLAATDIYRVGNRIVFWDMLHNNGSRYDFVTNTWEAMNLTNAPSFREKHSTASNGTDIYLWGGRYYDFNTSQYIYPAELYRYNTTANTWTNLGAPPGFQGRADCTMASAGNTVLLWSGRRIFNVSGTLLCNTPMGFNYDSSVYFTDGRLYNITNNTWTTVSPAGAPAARHNAAVVFDGSGIVITGGRMHRPGHPYCTFCPPISFCLKYLVNDTLYKSGARYDPGTNTWTAIADAPRPFADVDPLWDNDQYMTLFIGDDTTLTYEPSANDWFINLYPAVGAGYAGSRRNAFAVNNSDLVILSPAWSGSPVSVSCWSSRKTVYNLRPVSTTIRTVKSTQAMPGTRLYLYKKE